MRGQAINEWAWPGYFTARVKQWYKMDFGENAAQPLSIGLSAVFPVTGEIYGLGSKHVAG